MQQFNVICPLCGTVNKGLYLEETDGWMECEKCHNKSQSLKFANRNMVRIPVYSMEGLTAIMKQEKRSAQKGTA